MHKPCNHARVDLFVAHQIQQWPVINLRSVSAMHLDRLVGPGIAIEHEICEHASFRLRHAAVKQMVLITKTWHVQVNGHMHATCMEAGEFRLMDPRLISQAECSSFLPVSGLESGQ